MSRPVGIRKMPSQARRMRRARRVSECGRPGKPDAPPLGQLGSPEAREATVAPAPGVPVCHLYPPSGPAALAPVWPAGHRGTPQPGHSSDRLWYARNTWTCRLICPQDARSPRASGLCSRYGSLSQRYGSLSRQGQEGSRTGGGRAPERAGQDGQGTASGCPGSEARGTSRPGQARMGPGHRLGNWQGSPGAAPARNENGPGRLARQAIAENLGGARRRGPGPGQVAKITISVAGHRHEYRPAVGAARPRSVRGPQTGRYRGRQRRWPGLSTHRGLGVPTMCSHRLMTERREGRGADHPHLACIGGVAVALRSTAQSGGYVRARRRPAPVTMRDLISDAA